MAVALRDIRVQDKEQVRRWRNRPEVAKYMYTDHYISPEEHERWFNRISSDPACRYWIIEVDGQGVGVANLTDIDEQNRRCYWGFYLAKGVRGQGVASYVEYFILSYVFEELELNKLCGEVLSFNQDVVNMHKRFGFKEEGLLRQHVIKGGRPMDVVTIGILRSEWEAVKPDIAQRLRRKGLL